MKRLITNKRGQIPVVSDVANFIGSAFQWLTQSAPKPFRLVFFMLLLVVAASIFTFSIRMFGYHCNSQQTPYHTNPFNLIKNWELIQDVPDPATLTMQAIPTENIPVLGGISSENVGKCARKFTTATVNGQPVTNTWYYDGGFCTNCQRVEITDAVGATYQFCPADVQRLSITNKTYFQRLLCGGTYGGCEPPLGYYWRQTDNYYICNDPTICAQAATISDWWNKKLIDSGATPLYPAGFTQGLTTDTIFSIQCTPALQAQFTIWGIPIFDYRLWLFIMILILVIGLFKWVLTHK